MVAVTLFCAPVGEGSVFSVAIETSMSVGQLKDAIKSHSPEAITCDAKDLQLFLAKKNNAWLQDDAALRRELDTSFIELSDLCKLENPFLFGPNVSLGENVVHVLVVTPYVPHPARLDRWKKLNELLDKNKKPRLADADETDDMETACDSYDCKGVTTGDNIATPDIYRGLHPTRILRWEKLNKLLARNKKEMSSYCEDTPTVASSGDSFISFEDCEKIMGTSCYKQPSKAIAEDKIDVLYAYLLIAIRPFGWMLTGKDTNRLHTDKTVVGNRVQGEGHFDFFIEGGSTCVGVVLAKRQDSQKGLAQAYLGGEILADVEELTEVFSIVTDFKVWLFSKSLGDKVERCSMSMGSAHDIPERESLKTVAEKIYSLLSGDN
ncbi:Crinkler (CRN) family protein [Phytophthora infestans T30-4]|uniref:Crinkler (CRN) family protein n=1 Tax=Phytophthora infestans (strain T30-4) TaxID=403677 RepID=D0NJW6_PHYIT|nr:Crinkler (CRN) family protein [Phytophthora infestans T30-4]EEY59803.1 Crinkler (CRN) family protein [Phytophthora infestans T30-4]|eukprot:XP_002900488.1 Crinkler (CRN) family protein [Phytophthora infestans T30-4]